MSSRDDLDKWDAVADRYAATAGGEADSFYRRFSPFLWRHLGGTDLAGTRVLDLGCGHGWLAGIFARRGAEVLGVDGSEALVRQARAGHAGIGFAVHDLTKPLPAGLGTFDVVVSHMVLMDLPDIDPVMASVSGVLPAGGRFLFTILHPSFYSQPVVTTSDGRWARQVTDYLTECQWPVASFGGHTHYHRPLARYVESAVKCGLAVTGLDEPRTLPAEPAEEPEWTPYQRWFSTIPTMLSLACTKTG